MITERFMMTTSDDVALEARWDIPPGPDRAVVFCHPHPLNGGTMTAPLMERVAAEMVEAGMAVLRFNFRGVGESQGSWGGGSAELRDVSAAMGAARIANLPLGLTGWSFGAATALRWQAVTGDATPYCGIAPSVSDMPGAGQLEDTHRTIVMGERDQLIDFQESRSYADSIAAQFVPVSADHFFYYREDRVAGHVIHALGGRPGGG